MTTPEPEGSVDRQVPSISPRDAWLQGWFGAFAKSLDRQNQELEKIRNSVTMTFFLLLLVFIAGACTVLLGLSR